MPAMVVMVVVAVAVDMTVVWLWTALAFCCLPTSAVNVYLFGHKMLCYAKNMLNRFSFVLFPFKDFLPPSHTVCGIV